MRIVTTMAARTVAAIRERNTQNRPLRASRNWWKFMRLSWVSLEQALADVDHVIRLHRGGEIGVDALHARTVAAIYHASALGAAGSDPAAHGDGLHDRHVRLDAVR